MIARIVGLVGLVALLALGLVYAAGSGWLGKDWGPGTVEGPALPPRHVAERVRTQRVAADRLSPQNARRSAGKQVLFGDFHVHSTYSIDAFAMSLPVIGGDGAHPVADACDFARYCAELDFWSINDHAETSSPRRWRDTTEAVRQCNAVAGEGDQPDMVSYLGWEWTQIGSTPDDHYGHKNVVLRDLEDGRIPTRPIASVAGPLQSNTALPGPFLLGLIPFVTGEPIYLDVPKVLGGLVDPDVCPTGVPSNELPVDCREEAETPADLFAKLDQWGHESIVIPHGTTWGMYTPQGSGWDKQLTAANHDPQRQTLIEVMSGHGNSEEYRDYRGVEIAADGTRRCPAETPQHLPSCQRAGQLVRERCLEAGEGAAECEARAVQARQHYVDTDSVFGHRVVPGAEPEDWLDSGQCRDCYVPSFNHRPLGSAQAILALRNWSGDGGPDRFRFGFLASSDNHSARPGTGYKEYGRTEMTDARLSRPILPGGEEPPERVAHSVPIDAARASFTRDNEAERSGSFFYPGGLVAVHSAGRDRQAIWEALERREVYGTSGPRILLWFDLLNPASGREAAMGSQTALRSAPIFQARAAGSLEQVPGCAPHAEAGLDAARLERLCRGECYRPSEERRLITRLEVIRILPQQNAGEALGSLIEDPWRVFECAPDPAGCVATFSDPEFESRGRDAVYYVRAIEEPSPHINGNPLRCDRDREGRCIEMHVCRGDENEDCLDTQEERAWSSPIFVDFAAAR